MLGGIIKWKFVNYIGVIEASEIRLSPKRTKFSNKNNVSVSRQICTFIFDTCILIFIINQLLFIAAAK